MQIGPVELSAVKELGPSARRVSFVAPNLPRARKRCSAGECCASQLCTSQTNSELFLSRRPGARSRLLIASRWCLVTAICAPADLCHQYFHRHDTYTAAQFRASRYHYRSAPASPIRRISGVPTTHGGERGPLRQHIIGDTGFASLGLLSFRSFSERSSLRSMPASIICIGQSVRRSRLMGSVVHRADNG